MHQNLTQLLSTLDDEADAYREMRTILNRERAMASLSDRDRFIRVSQDKEALVQTLQQMESRRKSLVESLAAGYQIHQRPMTITLLARFVDAPYGDQLLARARNLKVLIKTVQAENNANSQLFSHYLDLIHGSLKLLNDLIYGQPVYNKPGTGKHASGYDACRGTVFCSNV
jgi:flagellar biosynthesis/type III secretory pathway chaperone